MDFFDLTDGRYEPSLEGGAEKYNRKTFTAKQLRSFEFGFALFEAFDTTGIGSLSEYEPILKIFAIYS